MFSADSIRPPSPNTHLMGVFSHHGLHLCQLSPELGVSLLELLGQGLLLGGHGFNSGRVKVGSCHVLLCLSEGQG
jgi:hypothetical protein